MGRSRLVLSPWRNPGGLPLGPDGGSQCPHGKATCNLGTYHQWFAPLERENLLRRPIVPSHCRHNAHMYYILLPNLATRTEFIRLLNDQGIGAVFHYVPLHNSPMGLRVGRAAGELPVTVDVSERLVRLPMCWDLKIISSIPSTRSQGL